MRILGIDTALGACSAAVIADGRVLAHAHEEMMRGQAEALAPMVASVMDRAQCAFGAIDRLGVTTGPGTFTGQRVGLAFVRGLALALKCPAIGVTTLDVMAEEALDGNAASWAAVVHDARRGEVYLGARSVQRETLIQPCLLAMEDAIALVAAKASLSGSEMLIAGTAAEAFVASLFRKGFAPRLSDVHQPDAIFVARLAAHARPTNDPPRPLYLRPPDARLPSSAA